ncbi:peptide ABC transporter substrate-binding protein [Fictibacillus aquaticus]|uniref:Periplasmic oligopeptide-binding protein OppA n=1 Tax=Fictibacillus aquaticus TaxID=2021314 RepID=A0A235FE54_9BACL|nr:peptide ABC transporter substrate-binding protein [Fictibacillus aquaticus]OYD59479.1 peptide ABC transporter substrate-binding protein [Fictibacillus aquaticus]
MKKTPLKVLSAILFSSLMLTACTGTGSKNDSRTENGSGNVPQVLNLLEKSEIPSMDTSKATDSVSFDVMNNVFEGLYRLDKNNKPVPGAAKSVDISKDGKTYTFHINENAKWSNGDPVTAEDFVYAWKKALHPETLSEYAYIMGPIKNANAIQNSKDPLYGKVDELGIKAVDAATLEVQLEAPAPYFLGLTGFPTFYPQNEKYVTSQGDKYALEVENMIYNGPFVLSEWKHEEGWVYKKNSQYWDKKSVKLDQINVNIVKDVGTGVNLYNTNESDFVYLSSEYVDQYKDNEDFNTILDSTVFFMRMNQKTKGLNNLDIRKAIDMAWDKQGLTDVILNDGSIPANFYVPKDFVSSPGGTDFRKENGNLGEYNPVKAKELWKKGLKAIGEKGLKLELLNYDSENSKKVGEMIQSQLETNLPGLKITINPQPFKQKLKLETKKEYDISYAGWGPDYQVAMTFLDMWITDGSHNQSNYSNPEYDRLIQEANAEIDQEKRWKHLLDAEKLMFADQVISPMFQEGHAYLQRGKVKDILFHSFGPRKSFKWTYISSE